jgi:hypothetical protein
MADLYTIQESGNRPEPQAKTAAQPCFTNFNSKEDFNASGPGARDPGMNGRQAQTAPARHREGADRTGRNRLRPEQDGEGA